MELGVYLPVYGGWLRGAPVEEPEVSCAYILKVAREAEKLGFHSVWVPDHLLNPMKGEEGPAIEAWTILTAVAASTKRIKVAHTTLCQSFRYPAVLAKMVATLDEISDGRFIFSIGAGWFRREYEAYGIPWYEHDERVEQAEEQIRLIKSLWTQDKVNFLGKYFQLKDGVLWPKPVQKPHPPVWYGGESERSRQLVAREADVWLMYGGSPENIAGKMSDMKARLNGRSIGYALPALVCLGETQDEAMKKIRARAQGADPRVLDRTLQTGMVGSILSLEARMREFEAIGVQYLLLQFGRTLQEMREFSRAIM